jgi:SNARE protein
MSSDAVVFDDELRSLEEQIQSCLRQMDTTSGEQRQDKFNRATELLKVAQKTFHHFKVEIRQLEPPESTDFERRCREHNAQITALKEQLAAKRHEATAVPAGGGNGHGSGSPGPGGYEHVDEGRRQARETKDRIQGTQQSALDALKRIEGTVQATQEVGESAAQKLAEQTEQMHRMNAKLDKLDSEVDRAKGELNAFIRRMMTDKIILCFILLVIIAVVAVVAIKLTNPDAIKFDPPPPPPPPPTTVAPPTPSP